MRCLRVEASGPGWHEHFVDTKRAATTATMGLAVSLSLSYVVISNFATIEERCALIDSAADKKEEDDAASTMDSSGGSGSNHILFASSANTNCDRYSVKTLLNQAAKTASSALLDRLLGFLDGSSGDNITADHDPDFIPLGGGSNMSTLAMEVFGSCTDLRSMDAVWYDEPDENGQLHPEPKVNVYSEGGYFNQHEDGMEMTILVVLSDEFEGGGTAFYRNLDLSHSDLDLRNQTNASHSFPAESIALPPAGSAMIWGGTLQHMALPVTKGTRAIYVGSFDLTEREMLQSSNKLGQLP